MLQSAGKVVRADKWTDKASNVVSTPTHQLGSVVSGVMSFFQFRYLALKCAQKPESLPSTAQSTPTPSTFEMLFHAQTLTHLPPPKVVQTKEDELNNDILGACGPGEWAFLFQRAHTKSIIILELWYYDIC